MASKPMLYPLTKLSLKVKSQDAKEHTAFIH